MINAWYLSFHSRISNLSYLLHMHPKGSLWSVWYLGGYGGICGHVKAGGWTFEDEVLKASHLPIHACVVQWPESILYTL